jgi:RNA polymerase sigma factor (sigma-70 family)
MAADTGTFFEKLFEDHNDGLLRYLTRKLNSSEEAEDIAQNAYIRIQALKELPPMENSKAYLYQVASNLIIDQKRREKLHTRYMQGEVLKRQAVGEFGAVDAESPEALLVAQRELESMQEVLNALPEKARRAFMMHRRDGLSYSDIANELGVTVSSVEKYILQALKHFRKRLQREAETLSL